MIKQRPIMTFVISKESTSGFVQQSKMSTDEKIYLQNYQYNHFQETQNDLYKTADVKRKCLAQTFKTCHISGNENLACAILQNQLQDVNEIVDDQSGINNYASAIESLTSNINKNYCLQWKNELKIDDFDDLFKSLQCCTLSEIPTQDFATLFHKKIPNIEPVKQNNPKNVLRQNQNVVNNIETVSNVDNFKNQSNNLQKKPVDENSVNRIPVQKNTFEENINNQKRNNCGLFKTARDELETQNAKKYGKQNNIQQQQPLFSYGGSKKSLGARRGIQGKFIPPVRCEINEGTSSSFKQNDLNWDEEIVDERLKNIDPKMVELIRSEIMDSGTPISWDDIAGLEFAKTIIKEVVVWPLLRPDIFTGLRRPPKGILLFGPPGTGKTLIGKCIASQSQSTFFSISASSLTSKWIGDGEKMVRAMFTVAKCHQPAVVFIDEIDSLLSQRSDQEHESSRRIKTEFLVQLDGAATGEEDRILVIGATNRPQELDEAARRRFVKRLYIPLPDKAARLQLVERLISNEKNELSEANIKEIADLSEGYSGADMKSLCAEASLGPIRSIDISMIQNIQADQVRPITMTDFQSALSRVRASVSHGDLEHYITWDRTYGAGGW